MKRHTAIAVVTLIVSLSTGCFFEAVYLSGAPDGTILVSAEGALVEVTPDLSKARLVADGVARAEVSPDGKSLLCIFYRDLNVGQHLDIAICNREAKVITPLGGADVSVGDYMPHGMIVPRWSPDGKFVSHLLPNPHNSDFTDLHVRDAQGTFDFVIPKVSSGYAWSPDSKEIAVISTASDDPDQMSLGSVSTWTVNDRAKTREPVGVFFYGYQSMAWTATNNLLFSAYVLNLPFLSAGPSEVPLQIFRLDLNTMDKLEPVLDEHGLSSEMAGLFGLSADEKSLAYIVWSSSSDLTGGLYVSSVDGTPPKKVLDESEFRSAPRWLGNDRVGVVTVEKQEGGGEIAHVLIIDEGGKTTDIWPLVEPVAKKAEADREARAREEEEQKQAAEPVKEFPSTSSTIQGTEATGK